MDSWIVGWMDEWIDGWIVGWMDGLMSWMDRWMDRWMDEAYFRRFIPKPLITLPEELGIADSGDHGTGTSPCEWLL